MVYFSFYFANTFLFSSYIFSFSFSFSNYCLAELTEHFHLKTFNVCI